MLFNCMMILLFSGAAIADTNLGKWLLIQNKLSQTRLLENISPKDAKNGAVVAATSRENPNYYSHWVRDAGIVLMALNDFDSADHPEILKKKIDHVYFSKHIQSLDNLAGRAYGAGNGEVRFNPDGSPFNQPWGRPQHDGPALRALSMMELYDRISGLSSISLQTKNELLTQLYSQNISDRSLIKSDLEYISKYWKTPSIDLWEELSGTHFYTLMTIRAALAKGEVFARKRSDPGAANYYQQQVRQLSEALERHWISQKGRIAPTLDFNGGLRGKVADLDISILLAVLHAELPHQSFDILDPRIIRSMTDLVKEMRVLYPINKRTLDFENMLMAPAIGRYPEDVYDGNGFSGGNPWFLATLSFAQWMGKIVQRAQTQELTISLELSEFAHLFGYELQVGGHLGKDSQVVLLEIAEQFFRRVRLHCDPRAVEDPNFSGRMREQYDRDSGFQRGAENLTWSYAAFTTAFYHYELALKGLVQSTGPQNPR